MSTDQFSYYSDFFGHDFSQVGRYRVTFSGQLGVLGVMLIPAPDEQAARHDAEDFNRRFALFVDAGNTKHPPTAKVERINP